MNLKKLRLEHNLTQKELANKINITQSNYSKYEKGILKLDAETLIKIADIFNVSLDYLCEHKFENNKILTKEEQEFLNLFYNASDIEKAKIIAYAKGVTNQPLKIGDFKK